MREQRGGDSIKTTGRIRCLRSRGGGGGWHARARARGVTVKGGTGESTPRDGKYKETAPGRRAGRRFLTLVKAFYARRMRASAANWPAHACLFFSPLHAFILLLHLLLLLFRGSFRFFLVFLRARARECVIGDPNQSGATTKRDLRGSLLPQAASPPPLSTRARRISLDRNLYNAGYGFSLHGGKNDRSDPFEARDSSF